MEEGNKKSGMFNSVGLWVLAVFLGVILVGLIVFGCMFFFKSDDSDNGKTGVEAVGFGQKNLTYVASVRDDEKMALNGAHEFWRNGNYLYITSVIDHGLEIMDVSNPAKPKHVGAFLDNDSTLMKKPHSVSFAGDYAFVGSMGDSAIQVFDIASPAKPVPVSSISDDENMGLKGLHGTSIYNGYLYIAGTGEGALTVLDISNPRELKHVKTIFDNDSLSLGAPHNMVFKDGYAYIITAKEGVQVMDVANPADPKPIAAFPNNTQERSIDGGHDIKIFGNYLVTASYVTGLNFFDISNPQEVVEIAEIHATKESGLEGAAEMNIAGNFLFVVSEVSGTLVMVDMTDPRNPEIKDVLKDDGSGGMFLWNGHTVYTIGEHVYVGGLQNGFGIVRYNK